MHDIRFIRDNPDAFDAGLKARGLSAMARKLIELDNERRNAISILQETETQRNAISKQIGVAKAKGDEDEFNRLRTKVEQLKQGFETAQYEATSASMLLENALAEIPNLPEDGVPVGADEAANEEVRGWGEPRDFAFTPKDHVDLGEGLGGLDFEAAAKMSGARFAVLSGGLARLERALAQFMLDLHTRDHGYREVSPPYMVRDEAMFGTGQLPKFEEDLFKIIPFDHIEYTQDITEYFAENYDSEEYDLDNIYDLVVRANDNASRRWKEGSHGKPYFLIPTSEVPLTNLVREGIHDAARFPMRVTAYTPCFRAEAGSAGRDVRGLIRMHQFHKVELVSIVRPEDSAEELDRMTECAETVLRALELPYRVMLLSTGDMGFAAKRTYDLEVWLPSQGAYREISSCSNCGDFQARRMNARYRADGGKPEFLHTLNGSGVAVGRALLAVLENHQNEDGSVTLPAALRPYMGGLERLEPDA
ncbi:MAG: serine--tRNA ligase [Maricaulaceae bacterium]|nr:serine--tRNA ligase [Maricaulaceae bacterium]